MDTNFGTSGSVLAQSGTNFINDYITSMELHPNGSIYLCGYSTDADFNYSFAFFGFTDTGNPLTAFGTNGSVVHQYQTLTVTAGGMAMQSDYKLVACGLVSPQGIFGSPYDFVALRVNGDQPTANMETTSGSIQPAFPNPTNNLIYLPNSSAGTQVCIMNVAGQHVAQLKTTHQLSIDLSKLPEGIYLLNYVANGNSEHVQIVKH